MQKIIRAQATLHVARLTFIGMLMSSSGSLFAALTQDPSLNWQTLYTQHDEFNEHLQEIFSREINNIRTGTVWICPGSTTLPGFDVSWFAFRHVIDCSLSFIFLIHE